MRYAMTIDPIKIRRKNTFIILYTALTIGGLALLATDLAGRMG